MLGYFCGDDGCQNHGYISYYYFRFMTKSLKFSISNCLVSYFFFLLRRCQAAFYIDYARGLRHVIIVFSGFLALQYVGFKKSLLFWFAFKEGSGIFKSTCVQK